MTRCQALRQALKAPDRPSRPTQGWLQSRPVGVPVAALSGLLLGTLSLMSSSQSLANELAELNTAEQIRQQQRLAEQQREQQANTPDVRLATDQFAELSPAQLPESESPCFVINQIDLVSSSPEIDANDFRTILQPVKYGEGRVLGRCLGTQGMRYLYAQVQNRLIEQGYITSQISIEAQDLTQGRLELTLHAGRLSQIYRSPSSSPRVQPRNAIPITQGQVLNLRDIEQGLENFRRLSSVDVKIDLAPAHITGLRKTIGSSSPTEQQMQGYSDLVIDWQQGRPIHLSLGIDDTGSDSTGKYQGSVGFTLDNPLQINDTLQLNYTASLDGLNSANGQNDSLYAQYSVPYGDWRFGTSFNRYDYQQTIAGLNQPIIYAGESYQQAFSADRLLSRGQQHKTQLNLKLNRRQSKNFIDEFEVEVQRRRTAYWEAGINHLHYLGRASSLSSELSYRKGIGAFSALDAPESLFNEGRSRPSVWLADLQLNHPFALLKQVFRYQLNWRGQYSPTILIPQDRFSIGGRFSVRGFSGDQALAGDQGFTLQQELNWNIPLPNSSLYLGIDHGWIGGESAIFNRGTQLTGGVLGLRTYYRQLSLDAFVGRGLDAPEGLSKQTVAGFNLNLNF